jgi:hypothetical protein
MPDGASGEQHPAMSAEAFKLLIVLNASACLLRADVQGQRLRSKHQITISDRPLRSVASASDATVRFRNSNGDLVLDDKAKLIVQDHGRSFVASELLAKELLAHADESTILFLHLEQAAGVLRAIAHFSTFDKFKQFDQQRPELLFVRLASRVLG